MKMTPTNTLLAVLLSAGCTSSQLPGTPVTLVVNSPSAITAGTTASGAVHNQSGHVIEVPLLGCWAQLELLDGSAWTAAPVESHYCIDSEAAVADGADYVFSFRVPTQPGTYRLKASVEGIELTSSQFQVR